MYSFIPAILFFGIAIWLYKRELKKDADSRNNALIMVASYSMVLALLLLGLSIINWGQL